MVFIVCNIELDKNIQLSLCVRPSSFFVNMQMNMTSTANSPAPFADENAAFVCTSVAYSA